MPAKKSSGKKALTEITKSKNRGEEEKFYMRFSETQLDAVLLLILGNTFFVQGASKFVEELAFTREETMMWFLMLIISLLFLVLSVGFIAFGGIINGLRLKRVFNLCNFVFFSLGIALFITSLVYLIYLLVIMY